MIIKNDEILSFVRNSQEAKFYPAGKEHAVAEVTLDNGQKLPAEVRMVSGQTHVAFCLPQAIIGKAAFPFYEEMAECEECFSFWVDPVDGETQIACHLEDETTDCLDAALQHMKQVTNDHWDTLQRFAALADAQSDEDKNAYRDSILSDSLLECLEDD